MKPRLKRNIIIIIILKFYDRDANLNREILQNCEISNSETKSHELNSLCSKFRRPMSSPTAATAASQLRQRLRPWPQFVDLSTFSLPVPLSGASFRISQNLRYFFPNYVLIILLTLFLSLIFHPWSLIIFLVVFAGWLFLYFSRSRDDPLILLNYEINDQIILGFLGLVTLLALIFANVWKNVIVSVVIGVLIVCIHGSLRAPEEDLESPYGSLLSDVTSPQGDYTRV